MVAQNLPAPALGTYFNASRLRTDRWSELELRTRRLAEGDSDRDRVSEGREAVRDILQELAPLEIYFAYPGRRSFAELWHHLEHEDHEALARDAALIVRTLMSDAYRASAAGARRRYESGVHLEVEVGEPDSIDQGRAVYATAEARPYFEVLVVDELREREERAFREHLRRMRQPDDDFVYELVVVPTFEDALIAALLNYNIQACVVRYGFPFASQNRLELLDSALHGIDRSGARSVAAGEDEQIGVLLGKALKDLRPTLDLFFVTDSPVEDIAGSIGRVFRRVFYRQEDYLELHLSLLKGIRERYDTPFFNALKTYSQRPTGVFHALPISRGKSITKSHWIRDMGEFYGHNIFLAETSATTGGLDSLLQPHGPLKRAQERAAHAFGARRTFFVTNGTSTANKVVMQALVRPGDIVLVSRDCHKSHHYALVLSGAQPVYLDPYPLTAYSLYGAVPISTIVHELRVLEQEGKLERVRMLLLTNSTFDGVVYNPARLMREVLVIKPDLIFVWDEAWSAFAYFTPISRRRTAMDAANRLRALFTSPEYRRAYEAHESGAEVSAEPMPDPDRVRVRVYATQSTHKTLTSLRQGSMIHINDQDFERWVSNAFEEAYMTHTSTSPNYQILASLDVGRRQVELEGYELIQHAVELAIILRERINSDPVSSKYFRALTPEDLVPAEYRASGFRAYQDKNTDWALMDRAWQEDELCLDPTRITLYIGSTGIDGESFKKRLIDEYDIQINKTSRNTVLFMTHIGTTRGSVAYLIAVLTEIAEALDAETEGAGAVERARHLDAVASLTRHRPPLPNFSAFHPAFRDDPEGASVEGDLRRAFFLSADEDNCEYLHLGGPVQEAIASGRQVVAGGFVTPYPPGFPVLVPGQLVSAEILAFLEALDIKEIHGYEPRHGLRILREEVLRRDPGSTRS